MFLKIRIPEEEYNNFKKICEKKNKNMSEVLRNFIKQYSDSDDPLITFNLDKDTLSEVGNLCKEKNVKFTMLIKFLLKKAIKNKDKWEL